jgi:hypothetical protein
MGTPSAIQAQIHGGGHFAHPFNVLAFIHGDLGPQRFGGPFHLLDTDFHARQFMQQRTALLEAHQRCRAGSHAQNSGRQGKRFQFQRSVPRAESMVASATVVVSPLQMQRSQHAFEGLPVTAVIAGHTAAGTR